MFYEKFEYLTHDTYSKSLCQKTIELLKACKFYYILGILSIVLMFIVDILIKNYSDFFPILKSNFNTKELYDYYGYAYGVFIITLGGPIVEELCFRLCLSISRLHIAISLSTLFLYFSGPIWFIDDALLFIIRLLISSIIFVFVKVFWNKNWVISDREIVKYWLLVCSSLVFGLIHIPNYHPIQYNILFLYPIYVLPQVIMGFITGILRLRNGFIWAVLFHVLVNTVSTLFTIFNF